MKDKDIRIYNLMSWICEHCYDVAEYAEALDWCGFTKEEIKKELNECCLSDGDKETVKEYF